MKHIVHNIAVISKELIGNVIIILFWIVLWDFFDSLIEFSNQDDKYIIYASIIGLYLLKTYILDSGTSVQREHFSELTPDYAYEKQRFQKILADSSECNSCRDKQSGYLIDLD